tara:strand:+ start:1562 stop:1687 length:126 start_codon:yes stop_codon:yes gene_type:complete
MWTKKAGLKIEVTREVKSLSRMKEVKEIWRIQVQYIEFHYV